MDLSFSARCCVRVVLSAVAATLLATAQTQPARVPDGTSRFAPPPIRAEGGAVITASAVLCRRCVDEKLQAQGCWTLPARRTLLGQDPIVVVPWLTHLFGKAPIVLLTPRVTLVVCSDGGTVDELSPREAEILKAWFPKNASPARTLDGHQYAHLLAERLMAIEAQVGEILDLGPDGRAKPDSGPTSPFASDASELFVFSTKAAYEAFVSHTFEAGTWPTTAVMLDSGPTAALLIEDPKSVSDRRRFAFTATNLLVRALSRAGDGLQAWLRIGLSHVIEQQVPGKVAAPGDSQTLPPDMKSPPDWHVFTRELANSGKSGVLSALAASTERGLSLRSRLQAASVVRWLIESDPARFGAFMRRLMYEMPTTPAAKALLNASRAGLGKDTVTLESDWKQAILAK